MPTVKVSLKFTFVETGQTREIPLGSSFTASYVQPVDRPVPSGTSCMQTFDLSPVDMTYVNGGLIINNTIDPQSALINGGTITLPPKPDAATPGGWIAWGGQYQGSGDAPATAIQFATEVFATEDGVMNCLFFGDP